MKRWIHATEDIAEQYTEQDLIDAINKYAGTHRPVDFEIAKEIMFDILKEDDEVVIEYPDEKSYSFTLDSKTNRYNNFRMEFRALLPYNFAPETSGRVATCNLIGEEIVPAIREGRNWYLNLH